MPVTLSQQEFEARYGKQNTQPAQTGQTLSAGQYNKKYGLPSHAGIKAFINSKTSQVNTGTEFLKQLVPAAANTLIGGPVKLLTSGAEGAIQSFKGKAPASGKTYHIPLFQPFKSFQSDAVDRAKQGQNPALNVGEAALGTAGAALDTFTGIEGAKGATNLVKTLGDKKAISDVWDMIKPDLSKTGTPKAAKSGDLIEKGLSKTPTLKPDTELIKAAAPYVKDAKTPLQAVTNMEGGIEAQATALQQGLKDTGAAYTKSQVVGALNKIEPSPEIVGDVAKTYAKVQAKMVSLVGDGGTLDKLLQARKDFDSYIKDSFPTLYSSDRLSPIKKAVLDIRGAVNDVIESRLPDGKLPDGTTFRQSLKNQSLLYDTIDNTAPKVKVGEPTTVVGKLGSKAGKAAKNVIKGAATYEGAKRLFTGHF